MSSRDKRAPSKRDYQPVDQDIEDGLYDKDGYLRTPENQWYTGYCGMYLIGMFVCGMVEGVLLFFQYFWSPYLVGLCTTIIFGALAIFVVCGYWNADYYKQLLATCIMLAVTSGMLGGMWGGQAFHLYWRYRPEREFSQISASADPMLFKDATTYNFIPERTYVKQSLTGVFDRVTEQYCAAPILTKDSVPQDAVIYWAIDKDCCSGISAGTVKSHCQGWERTDFTGEVLDGNTQWFYRAMAMADEWNDFASMPNPVFVRIMTHEEHDALQYERWRFGMLVVWVAIPIWPVLALGLGLMRELAIVTCGLKAREF